MLTKKQMLRDRVLHDGKLDARFLNLVFMGKVADATADEQALAQTLRRDGLTGLKERLGLPPEYPVLPLVIDAPGLVRANNRPQRAARRYKNGMSK